MSTRFEGKGEQTPDANLGRKPVGVKTRAKERFHTKIKMLGFLTFGLALTLHASFGKTDSMALLARIRSEDVTRPMFSTIKARLFV